MLVDEDGKLTGAISGGCLEGDALKKALWVMRQDKAMLVKYDTSDEDDGVLGVGLGCNGIIHILIEPLQDTKAFNPLLFLSNFIKKREAIVLSTVFTSQHRDKPQPGTCIMLSKNETIESPHLPEYLNGQIMADSRQALHSGYSCIKQYADPLNNITYDVFIEVIHPPVLLNIAGAGNDVMPLVNMAAVLGWDVTIFDGRPNLLTKERFPLASKLIHSKPENILSHIEPDYNTVFALLTHNYNYDLQVLKAIIVQNIPYVGVLGPKKKLDAILQSLKDEGIPFGDKDLEKVYGPAGVDIAAETSEEIALSILTEIKAVLSGKKANFLKEKQGPIHDDRIAVESSSTKLFQSCPVF